MIGVDLREADIEVDLATVDGRARLAHAVARAAADGVDAVIACAGIAADHPDTISVNFFGAVATLEGLRPLLSARPEPRVVVVGSVASILGSDEATVDACLAGDEGAARAAAGAAPGLAYLSSKTAICRWVRRTATTEEWAGAGITLNAVAPGTVTTPMTAPLLATEGGTALVDGAVPMPLDGHAAPEDVASLIDYLAGADNTQVTGQVVFVDGGADAVLRGDSTW